MRWPWHLVRALLPPVALAALVVVVLREPITWWLHGEAIYDREVIKEWIREARNTKTLPELTEELLELLQHERRLNEELSQSEEAQRPARETALRLARQKCDDKREEIEEFLKAIGNAPTKIYSGQLPLFPVIYRISVTFDAALDTTPVVWDSQFPRQRTQYRELHEPIHPQATVTVQYHLHAYQQRQIAERQEATRRLWVGGLGMMFALLALIWAVVAQRRERLRELRRQEAERRQEEAERQNLELKSQLFANIGIMAGSYAHNIKNLLVRPNDLLRRCLDDRPTAEEQAQMLREVRQTLMTVTERLQQILATVRRDPSKSEPSRLDVGLMLHDLHAAWSELAREKWKLDLTLDVGPGPLWIDGDRSHVQQALENLLFNARDATFEMRSHLREQARRSTGPVAASCDDAAAVRARRQAIIDAAAWRGAVTLRTYRRGEQVVIEVVDNGIGMTEEVRRRCTEPHFSTKRDNALFTGLTAGMGLGLSFVQVILQHHRAVLEVESQPLRGATFRVFFPAAAAPSS
ncbi:MAG: HAMP domain-containing histidine kinase [Gemmataceae bacterium]|nr:HAMP domain-containing histidine kinase [Gemmataceae bacterium]